jgi:cyanate permease
VINPAAATLRKPTLGLTDCLRSSTFWTLLGAHGAGMFAFVAFLPHAVAMVADRGFTRSQAVTSLSMFAVGSFCGHLTTGFSLDATKAPRVMVPFVSVSLAGLLLLHHTRLSALLYPAAFMIGIGAGGEVSILSYFITRYFGVGNYAKIYGYMVPILMTVTAPAPVLAGVLFDRTGSYDLSFWLIESAVALTIPFLLLLKPYPSLALQPAIGFEQRRS